LPAVPAPNVPDITAPDKAKLLDKLLVVGIEAVKELAPPEAVIV